MMIDDTHNSRLSLFVCLCCAAVVSHLLFESCLADARGYSKPQMNVSVRPSLHVVTQPQALLMAERASSNMIGTIMTLLAMFDEAGILPSEGTAQANQVIHGLIQLQSTLMKTTSAELAAYQSAAEDSWEQQHPNRHDGVLKEEGLTLMVLEALIAYDQEHPMWTDPKIASAMQVFNVSQADWLFIVKLFNKANVVFRDQGRSMHAVYDAWRLKFPGGKT